MVGTSKRTSTQSKSNETKRAIKHSDDKDVELSSDEAIGELNGKSSNGTFVEPNVNRTLSQKAVRSSSRLKSNTEIESQSAIPPQASKKHESFQQKKGKPSKQQVKRLATRSSPRLQSNTKTESQFAIPSQQSKQASESGTSANVKKNNSKKNQNNKSERSNEESGDQKAKKKKK